MSRIGNLLLSVSALSAALSAAPARAQDVQALQELFQSEVVFPQDAGETQVTLAPQFSAGRGVTRQEVQMGLEYGLTDAWQIGVDWPGYLREAPTGGPAVQGIGDLELATKYSWMNIADSHLHAALELAVVLPTSNKSDGLDIGQFALMPSAVLAADIPGWSGAQAFVNFGGELNDGTAHDGRRPWIVNFGAFAPIRQFTLTSEWNFSQAEGNFYTPGIVWRTPAAFELGLGVPVGLDARSDRYRVILTLVREFG